MSGIPEAALRVLRQRYRTASDAYTSCLAALTETDLRGERPSAELLENEAAALRQLKEAREKYREALMQIAFTS